MKSARKRLVAGPPLAAVLGRGDLGASLVLIFPLFLFYSVGLAFTPAAMNGVDYFSRNAFSAVGGSLRNYLIVQALLGVGFVATLAYLRRHGLLRGVRPLPLVLESAIYALTVGSFILFVMQRALGMDLSASAKVVASVGAGVHEELVFRLGVFAGGAALLRTIGLAHGAALVAAALTSAGLFSWVHHVGPVGDAFAWDVFTYRFLYGLAAAALFYFRSLATAVYTHAFYDIYVMLWR